MNIFIKDILPSTSEEELTELFGPHGTIESIYIVKDKHSGVAKGEAYIIMPVDTEAEQAILSLNGTDFKGQILKVMQAEASDFPSGDYW